MKSVYTAIRNWIIAHAGAVVAPRDGKGILFLDELNAAPTEVQAACYRLVLDRKLGEIRRRFVAAVRNVLKIWKRKITASSR